MDSNYIVPFGKGLNNSVSMANGLIMYLPLNDLSGPTITAPVKELSGFSNGVHCGGITTFTMSTRGRAFFGSELGETQAVIVPNNNNWSSIQDFTVAAWVYCTNNSGYHQIFMKDTANTNLIGFLINLNSVFVQYGGGGNVQSNVGFTINKWFFLAGIRSSGNISIYSNGVRSGTLVTNTTLVTTTADAYIGVDNVNTGRRWGGYIQNIGFWRRALSTQELNRLYYYPNSMFNNSLNLIGSGPTNTSNQFFMFM